MQVALLTACLFHKNGLIVGTLHELQKRLNMFLVCELASSNSMTRFTTGPQLKSSKSESYHSHRKTAPRMSSNIQVEVP